MNSVAGSSTACATTNIGCLFVIGLGLIGGSIAKAAKHRGLAQQVLGFDASADAMTAALRLSVVDDTVTTIEQGLAAADLVLIAVPALAVPDVFTTLKRNQPLNCVVTDVSSVKTSVREAAKSVFTKLPEWLVLGHPIAGSEKSGVEAANTELFDKHKVILTPAEDTDAQALALVERLWQGAGADVRSMPVEQHDEIFAAVSHLPHILAYALVDTLISMESRQKMFAYAAGGFRDFSRIASSNPQMWHDIVLANRNGVLASIDDFIEHLMVLRSNIERADSTAILDTFTRSKAARDDFVDALDKASKD